MLYSGLFGTNPVSIWAKLTLALVAAALAFVGAVSALSITRAFGVIFLGNARDADLPQGHEASGWMLVPMGIHTAGTALLGIAPALGFAMVAAPTALLLHGVPDSHASQTLHTLVGTLTRVGVFSATLVLVVVAVLWLRGRLLRPSAPANATWGCGYTAASARMQYTGASFSTDFAAPFKGILLLLKRRKAPTGYFPSDSYVITDCVDAVERRLYAVIGHGDESATDISRKMHEDDPRLAFAAGLAGIVTIAALIVLSEGAMP